MFTRRKIEPELLDNLAPEEARRNLIDLARINRHLGGHSVLRKTLARSLKSQGTFSILDVGAASGDSGRLIRQLYPSATVVSLDRSPTNLEQAGHPKLIADAFRLPFSRGSFDYVVCSLFLHHFEDQEIVRLLRSFHQVARQALLVCDLERHVIPYLFLALTKPLFGWRNSTVHDGQTSVRASFRAEELRRLARCAGIRDVQIDGYRPAFRLAMIAGK